MPKSNDIHFAQSPQSGGQTTPTAGNLRESSVAYETFNANSKNNNNNNNRQLEQDHEDELVGEPEQPSASRTLLSTESKALILALPIFMSQSFAGYEPGKSSSLPSHSIQSNSRDLCNSTDRLSGLRAARQQVVVVR